MRRRHHIAGLWLFVAIASPARAHNGPPFPIVTDRRVGPCVISLWTHPDVGIGTFWVMVDPPPGGAIPKDLKFEIGVQPVSGRLKEKRYAARLDGSSAQVQYYVEVPFDAQELWRVHLLLDSAAGHGESTATVEVTPPGLGRWDLLWYASPFAAVAFLWFRVLVRRKKRNSQPTGA
ncbi:MAG TPA: hypothetical protein VN924_21685 [Bryobacteraceae bacterium]|jgi:hypothetical protein|nr:hypothetical protein [Bryobacteraceae bacterium]